MADDYSLSTMASQDIQQSGQNVQRDAWKSIRTHIHHYEQKLAELQFDYQQKVNVVEALKLQMRQLAQSTRNSEENEYKMNQEAHTALKDAMELERQLMSAEKDRIMLTQQLVVEQKALEEDVKTLEDTKAMFQEHLQAQQDYINKLKELLVVPSGDASFSSGTTAGGVSAAQGQAEAVVAQAAGKECSTEDSSDVAFGQVDQGLAAHSLANGRLPGSQ